MLRDFPAEVLAVVTSFLQAEHISGLWCCGSVLLNQKLGLQGGVQSFSMEWNSSRAFAPPTLILAAKHLTALEMRFGEFNDTRAFGNQSQLIEGLPVTLKKLTLSAYDALSSLTNIENAVFARRTQKASPTAPAKPTPVAIAMNRLFPNLESLDITSQIGLSFSFFDNLPRALVELKLMGMVARIDENDFWAPSPLSSSASSSKSSLYTLVTSSTLHPEVLQTSSQPKSHSTQLESPFPPTLKVFETDAIYIFADGDRPPCLPDTLERLTIHTTMQEGILSRLPRSLLFLSLVHVASRSRDIAPLDWKDLPPQLERFWVNRKHFTPQEMQSLPRSLTHLTIDTSVSVDDNFVPHLPPNLKKLCMGYEIGINSTWNALPRSLQWISDGTCPALRASSLHLLPSNLTRFDSSHLTLDAVGMAALPRSIKMLRMAYMKDELAPHLPPHLERLSINAGRITPESLSQWPKGIQNVQLSNVALSDSNCFAHFPPSLSILTLNGIYLASDEPPSFHLLPPSLTKLFLQNSSKLQTDSWLMSLPKSLRLKTLESTVCAVTTSAVFIHLPPSLRSLNISLLEGQFDPERLSHLPRGLHSLKLQSKTAFSWPDDSMVHLPRGLHLAELPNCPEITASSASSLPTSLVTLSFGDEVPFWWSLKRRI